VKDDAQAYEGREFEAASNLVNYYNWITDQFHPYLYGSGVEIGAGIGTYSQYLRPFFSTLDVVEPSPIQRDSLAQRFQSDENVHAFSETIDRYRQRRGDETIDSICMVNVLEHIDDDHTALLDLTAILKKGGHLCIFVPALPSWMKFLAIIGDTPDQNLSGKHPMPGSKLSHANIWILQVYLPGA